MFVRLKKDWPGSFRRTVKDDKGEAVSILEWSPTDDGPMEITDELELKAIANDIGHSLVEVKPPVTRPDPKPEPAEQPKVAVEQKPVKGPKTQKTDSADPLRV